MCDLHLINIKSISKISSTWFKGNGYYDKKAFIFYNPNKKLITLYEKKHIATEGAFITLDGTIVAGRLVKREYSNSNNDFTDLFSFYDSFDYYPLMKCMYTNQKRYILSIFADNAYYNELRDKIKGKIPNLYNIELCAKLPVIYHKSGYYFYIFKHKEMDSVEYVVLYLLYKEHTKHIDIIESKYWDYNNECTVGILDECIKEIKSRYYLLDETFLMVAPELAEFIGDVAFSGNLDLTKILSPTEFNYYSGIYSFKGDIEYQAFYNTEKNFIKDKLYNILNNGKSSNTIINNLFSVNINLGRFLFYILYNIITKGYYENDYIICGCFATKLITLLDKKNDMEQKCINFINRHYMDEVECNFIQKDQPWADPNSFDESIILLFILLGKKPSKIYHNKDTHSVNYYDILTRPIKKQSTTA
jgi:hypothetical protein